MTATRKEREKREELISALEERREKLGITRRALALKAGLNASYYQHLVAGGFKFPTIGRLDAILATLDRLEKVAEFEAGLE